MASTADGHKPKDTLNEKQEATMLRLVETLRAKYGKLPLMGHTEFAVTRHAHHSMSWRAVLARRYEL